MSERPDSTVGNVMFDITPSIRVNIWLTGDITADAALMRSAYDAVREWLGDDRQARERLMPAPTQRPQQGRQQSNQRGGGQRRQQGGGRGEKRTDKYRQIDGECDICGGPVGRYPRTGNMRSDKAVCLGTCKDGDFIHTAFWLDDDNGGGFDDVPPPDDDDMPF